MWKVSSLFLDRMSGEPTYWLVLTLCTFGVSMCPLKSLLDPHLHEFLLHFSFCNWSKGHMNDRVYFWLFLVILLFFWWCCGILCYFLLCTMNFKVFFPFSLFFVFFLPCRRYKEKKEEVAEPEADPERDQRTVFAYQVSLYILTNYDFCFLCICNMPLIIPRVANWCWTSFADMLEGRWKRCVWIFLKGWEG